MYYSFTYEKPRSQPGLLKCTGGKEVFQWQNNRKKCEEDQKRNGSEIINTDDKGWHICAALSVFCGECGRL